MYSSYQVDEMVCGVFFVWVGSGGGGVLVVSDDVQASELVVESVWVSLSGNRELVCLVWRSGWRAFVRMSAVLFLDPTPPIRMASSM
jgi:hypothetical protein